MHKKCLLNGALKWYSPFSSSSKLASPSTSTSFSHSKRRGHKVSARNGFPSLAEEFSRCTRAHERRRCTFCTGLKGIQELLQPQQVIEKYREHAPFMWKLLYTFAAIPNKARKQMAKKRAAMKTWDTLQIPEGFTRNPMLVS